jgi:hypothetical protein
MGYHLRRQERGRQVIDIKAVRGEIWRRTRKHTLPCQRNQLAMKRGWVYDFKYNRTWKVPNLPEWQSKCGCDQERYDKWVADSTFSIHVAKL